MSLRRDRHPDMNLNDLDYSITYQLCQNFDVDRSWEVLAGTIGYSTSHIQTFELEVRRHDGSPTKKVLWDWGTRGATVRNLYDKLALINKTHSMRLLQHIMNKDDKKEEEEKKEKWEKDLKENEKRDEVESKKSNNLLSMPPDSGTMSYNPTSLPIPSMKKCGVAMSLSKDPNLDVNMNTPGVGLEKGGDKRIGYNNKVLGVVPDQGASSVEMSECHADGPASTKGNMGAASSSVRSFERVRSVIEEYSSETTYMSQLSHEEKEIARALMGTPHYTYKELSQATQGFSLRTRLGQGKYGAVYLGQVKKTKCAIKKLMQKRGRSDEENSSSHLASELKALSRYRHENIVSLYGYALDGDEVCLVYQYMQNGSLDDCLHCKNNHQVVLTAEQRLSILMGAACGLQYLHSVGTKPVIHGDIKSANILLDRHFEAKIGDLGLAQQATGGETAGKLTHITKKTTGTQDYKNKAYNAPEIQRGGGFSIKGDTYAFGVVIFECLTGQEAYDERREGGDEAKTLTGYIEEMLDDPKVDRQKRLEDKRLDITFDLDLFNQLFDLAENCVKDKKKDRPTMEQVFTDLEALDKPEPEYDNVQSPKRMKSFSKELLSPCSDDSKRTMEAPHVDYVSNGGYTPGLTASPRPPQLSLGSGRPTPSPGICASPIDCLPKNLPLPEAYRLQLERDLENGKITKDHYYENVEKLKKEQHSKVGKSDKQKQFDSPTEETLCTIEEDNSLPKSDSKKATAIEDFDAKNMGGVKKDLQRKPSNVYSEYPSDPKKLEMIEGQDEVLKSASLMATPVYENVPNLQKEKSEKSKPELTGDSDTKDKTELEEDMAIDAECTDLSQEFAEIENKALKGDSSMMDIFRKFDDQKEDEDIECVGDFTDDGDNIDFCFDFESADSETSTITESINEDFDHIDINQIEDDDLFAHERLVSYENVPAKISEKALEAKNMSHKERLEMYKKVQAESEESNIVQGQSSPVRSQGSPVEDSDQGQPEVKGEGQTSETVPSNHGNVIGSREPTEGECYV